MTTPTHGLSGLSGMSGLVGDGGGSPPPSWSPLSLPAGVLRQYALDGGLSYEANAIDGLQVLRSLEPYGTYRQPRQGRCWLFDGTDDFGTPSPSVISGVAKTAVTYCCWVRFTNLSRRNGLFALDWAFSANRGYGLELHWPGSGVINSLRFYVGSTSVDATFTPVANQWYHLVATHDGANCRIYLDGSLFSTVPLATQANLIGSETSIGSVASIRLHGAMRDVRLYNVAKNATEVQSIFNGQDDTVGLLAQYPCNEESGTTGYDISGNGNHLTLINITQSTFHATDTGVSVNRNNTQGYRLSSSVYIPKRLTDANAADGNALTVTGQSPYPANVEVPCITGDGTSVYAELGSQLLPATADFVASFAFFQSGAATLGRVFSQNNNTCSLMNNTANGANTVPGAFTLFFGGLVVATVAGVADGWTSVQISRTGSSISMSIGSASASGTSSATLSGNTVFLRSNAFGQHSTGRIADFRITTGGITTHFPLQEGTSRDLHFVRSDGTYGVVPNAIVNGTVSSIWANRCPNAQDWCVLNGGRIAASGAFVPGQISGSLAADGNAKTVVAGKFGNPFSRINFNPFAAAELNGLNVGTVYPEQPVVTGDGSTVYANLGSALIPATADFAYSLRYFHNTGTSNIRTILDQRATTNIGIIDLLANWNGTASANKLSLFVLDGHILSAVDLVPATWNLILVSRVGNTFTLNLNGVDVGSFNKPISIAQNQVTSLFAYNVNGVRGDYSDGRISDLRVTTGGVTTHFPLADGSGRDLAWYRSDGISGIVTNAIVGGTESAIWANRNVNSSPFARRAIVPRDTKYRRTQSDGDDRFFTTATALTGSDKTNAETYVS